MCIKKRCKKLSAVLVLVLLFSLLSAGAALGATTTPASCWAWGNNDLGQLGDGTKVSKSSPTQVGTDTDWAAVSAGFQHTLALKENGTLWAWGSNAYGGLGDGTITDRYSPTQIGTDTWKAVSVGNFFSLAIRSDDTLWAWGWNYYGQLGLGYTSGYEPTTSPTQVGTDTDWAAVSTGCNSNHALALKMDGTLWAWGRNGYGQLGDGTNVDKSSPTQTGTAGEWEAAVAGYYHTLALKPGGSLYTWGSNSSGQLGDGTTVSKSGPTQVGAGNTWLMISGGYQHSVALAASGPAATVLSVDTIPDINVANGTAPADVGLPATIGVTLSDDSNTTLGVTWDGGNPAYDGDTAGTYAFTGTLSLTAGITNPGSLTASVNVIVAAAPVATYTVSVSASPPEGGRVSSGGDYLSALQ